ITCSPTWCAWFPDGRRLLFAAVVGVSHQIGVLDTVDGTITALDQTFVMQRDQPRLFPTPDLHSFATVHSTPQHPPDVYHGSMTGEGSGARIAWQRLTRLNPIAEETWAWATSQPISYPSVDDHLVHALFTPPVTAPGDTPPPLFVDVHGGPSGASCNTCTL